MQILLIGLLFGGTFTFIGVTNNQDGPVWLGLMILFMTLLAWAYMALEDYVITKLNEW